MGKTFVVGDIHGTIDIGKVHKWYNKNQKDLTKDDILLILGDWGAVWYEPHNIYARKKDIELQLKWAKKKFTLAVVTGNHENYNLIEKLPIEEKWGGKVRVLTPVNPYNGKTYGSIYLLERGEIYTINGSTFLALGGARSHDIAYRIKDEDWWEQELWTREQENTCLDNLDKYNWEVDYVIAHTCTTEVIKKIVSYGKTDPLSNFFSFLVEEGLKFKEWHFGHLHEDVVIDGTKGKYFCHYEQKPERLIND